MIHYHGAPISGPNESQLAFAGKHVMVSYAEASCLPLIAEVCQSFTLDNGAFSAWKAGKEFDIEGFAAFVEKWHKHPAFDWYVMPDVIDGGPDENLKMRATWFTLVDRRIWSEGIPVWHFDEPMEVLRDLSNWSNMICLGSSGAYSDIGTSAWWGRIAEAMKIVTDEDGFPKCKLHGLRMLDPDVFTHIPLKSADSTNVARNAGLDTRWTGPYVPPTQRVRALVMMDRIEKHASATRWNGKQAFRNWELFG